MYVIAGFSGEERHDVWRFDLQRQNWQEVVPDDPAKALPARSVFGAVLFEHQLVRTIIPCQLSAQDQTNWLAYLYLLLLAQLCRL